MNDADPLTAFYLALDEMPGDRVTMLALADWYEEHGEISAAECLRWLVEYGLYPFRYRKGETVQHSPPAWHEGWYWWAVENSQARRNWRYPRSCCLPQALWDRLKHYFDYPPSVFKDYPTGRAAYEALFTAWPTVRKPIQ
jgi:uncharacterized protein (TIGR02996 family)